LQWPLKVICKRRKSGKYVTLQIKQGIVEKSEKGGKTSVPAKERGLFQSTISTILLHTDKIQATEVSDASAGMIKEGKGLQTRMMWKTLLSLSTGSSPLRTCRNWTASLNMAVRRNRKMLH
jgi:hypothetical protein